MPSHEPTHLPAFHRENVQKSGPENTEEQPSQCDLAIVGGGITGLSAALDGRVLGAEVVLFEGGELGSGASGRGFGQVLPYAKHQHGRILRDFGPEAGERIVEGLTRGPGLVKSRLRKTEAAQVAKDPGLLFAAHRPSEIDGLIERARYWQARGADVHFLGAGETEALIGSKAYDGALLDRRGFTVNPFEYLSGLAGSAAEDGATLLPNRPVEKLVQEGARWRLHTPKGDTLASAVLLCTNAYDGGLWPGLSAGFIALRAYQLVTAPLNTNVWPSLLPGGQALTDTRKLFSGVKRASDRRLHVSADGPLFDSSGRPDQNASTRRLADLFPQLGPIEWQEAWSGWVAVTADEYPRLHELAPGLWTAYGYTGRGIALASLLGRQLALQALGHENETCFWPVTPFKPMVGRSLAAPAVQAIMAYYRLKDRWETRGIKVRARR